MTGGDDAWNGEVVLWVHSAGKHSLLNDRGRPNAAAMGLVEAGYAVMAMDVLLTGEFTKDGQAVEKAPINDANGRARVSAYMHGYNRPLFVKRVHDVLTAVAFVANNPDWDAKAIHLAGVDEGGAALVLAARTQCEGAVGKTLAALHGTRLGNVNELRNPWFVPGAVKYRDLPGLMALGAPEPLWLIDADASDLNGVRQAYLASDSRDAFVQRETWDLAEALAWLKGE